MDKYVIQVLILGGHTKWCSWFCAHLSLCSCIITFGGAAGKSKKLGNKPGSVSHMQGKYSTFCTITLTPSNTFFVCYI